jgi:hypothetical protein
VLSYITFQPGFRQACTEHVGTGKSPLSDTWTENSKEEETDE